MCMPYTEGWVQLLGEAWLKHHDTFYDIQVIRTSPLYFWGLRKL